MENQISSNVNVSADFKDGKLEVKAEIGMVEYAEKAAAWIKSRRPGGIEDPIADGFVALVKQLADEEAAGGGDQAAVKAPQ